MTLPIDPALAEKLSYHQEHGLDLFILQMDLHGLETGDPDYTQAVWAQCKPYLAARRHESGVLSRFRAIMLTNADLAKVLGFSKSMVQAMVSGRLGERYTATQVQALRATIIKTRDESQKCLDALG
jgi:hypothetical protein